MWALTEWLPDGEQLIASRQYRYTSSVVTGEVDLEDYSVTWHITPETVDGFAVTNIPALVTTSMFSAKEGLSREELLVVLLHHLGLKADASPLEVKAEMLKLKRFTAAGETASDAEADTPPPSDGAEADGEADGEEAGAGEAGPGEPAPPPPAAEPPVDELALTRTELATARKRIADLEVEAGAAFVKSLPHSGKLTPAQRKAAEDQARTPTGLARRRGRRARRGGRRRHRSQHSQKVASAARWGGGRGEGSERLSRATDDPPRAVRGEISSLQYSGTPETTCPFGQIRSDR